MNAFLLVGLGGGLGAMARYGVGLLVGRWAGHGFPIATLAVNIAGSMLMGLMIAALARLVPEWSPEARLFAGVGLLGGFTTFSAFSLDAVTLFERGDMVGFVTYIAASVIGAILALAFGLWLARAVF